MGYANKKRTSRVEKQARKDQTSAHTNWMGAPSWDLSNPLVKLRIAAASCFFGEPMYYHRDVTDGRPEHPRGSAFLGDDDVRRLREVLDAVDPVAWRELSPAALTSDPEGTLQFAVELRQKLHIRLTPQVILVRAAHNEAVRKLAQKVASKRQHGHRHPLRNYARSIIQRPDEPANGLAYQLAAYGRKAIPNVLKKAWRDALERFGEHGLAKYRMDSKEVSLRDVAHLVHPTGPAGSAIYKLRGGELVLGEDATWERSLSSKGSSKESWENAVPKMGHMALLRNLRNLLQHGVAPSRFVDQLKAGAATGQQLPFRYWSAFKALADAGLNSAVVQDAIEDCLLTSLGNLPMFSGRSLILVDNSGSAWGTATSKLGTVQMAEIGNLTGIITARRSDEGVVGVFGDGLELVGIRKHGSVFEDLEKVNSIGRRIGASTEHGIWLALDQAIRSKTHYDHIFVYSDMQAGHGGLYGESGRIPKDVIWTHGAGYGHPYIDVPTMITRYRNSVSKNVMVYLVQIAGYQDTIIPEYYNRTFILGGWSEHILHFADAMAKAFQPAQS